MAQRRVLQGCTTREGTSKAAPEAVTQAVAEAEEVAEAVGGGYRRLQMPLSLAPAATVTVARPNCHSQPHWLLSLLTPAEVDHPRHGGATTTGPDATNPPAICQNLGGGGQLGGGVGMSPGGGGGVGGRVGRGIDGMAGGTGVSLGCTKGAEQGPNT